MTIDDQLKQQLDNFRRDFDLLKSEIAKVIVGQHEILDDMLISLIAGGHVLLEGVPGLGKTLTVRTLAEALHLDFHRIQFTPDLMPADLIGTQVIVESPDGRKGFEFQRGPLFANVLLADEINRATPKTQSALLEAMQEHSVTVAGTTHQLAEPFFVMATQNPLEMEGTYPLPEAQLDRFFCKLLVKYPTVSDLETILDRTTESIHPRAEAVMTGERILEMSALARLIPIASDVRRYGIAMVVATHPEHELAAEATKKYVRYGASPRGLQSLILGAKIRAILDNRYHVAREDLRCMATPVLRHRLILNFEGQAEGISADDVIAKIIADVAEDSLAAA
ncbi:AAA family ATPase [Allorhodopirellula solitaria]|uniref:Holliday junction ATP-dependent DNA helicase RuvB n=1 Tax=Allorhodopirellula solitaria TaxID=2527987 RepID=A0A5C5YBT9_9BACT|nr:AAA family ATPase [Allorhodopirellula solitaria]TWT72850.1 Holliday junction ATP-dependent DNA helicase RuvB [Allorhodopirellula solitaria]